MGLINSLLAHPLTKTLSVDDPRTTEIRHEIIQSKPFLKSLYQEWYKLIIQGLGNSNNVLEIGSGAGFLYRLTRYLESKLSQQKWAMFAYIEIELLPA